MLEIRNEAVLKGLAGGALLWVAVRGEWIVRLGAAASGAALLYSAWDRASSRPQRLLTEPTAAAAGDEVRVDQSSWESFPASDPPGY